MNERSKHLLYEVTCGVLSLAAIVIAIYSLFSLINSMLGLFPS